MGRGRRLVHGARLVASMLDFWIVKQLLSRDPRVGDNG
jgi:hypothetical protein